MDIVSLAVSYFISQLCLFHRMGVFLDQWFVLPADEALRHIRALGVNRLGAGREKIHEICGIMSH
jgi:hypothetical protein